MSEPYRTLFVGTLVQESFLSVGGTDDPNTTVDSPFCRDGRGQPTLRGTGLAGALIATLRRCLGAPVPESISGSRDGRQPSVWRFFNGHPLDSPGAAYRQHVAIDARTGAAATGMLFNVETLPPGTRWPFLLEVDTSRDPGAADQARNALRHWAAGRCLIGREVARGLGWMRLEGLREYRLTVAHLDDWPCAKRSDDYAAYIEEKFANLAEKVGAAKEPLPGWTEITGSVSAGEYKPDWGNGATDDVYGIDSLSIGGHATEELAAAWDERFLAPDGMQNLAAAFDPDFAIVTFEQRDGDGGLTRVPYIPGSSLRGPLRHALARLLRARGEPDRPPIVETLFGTVEKSAKLLIRDAFPDDQSPIQLAWLQHHAEDEFTGGAYGHAKFDRVAVMQGRFVWRMVLEDASEDEQAKVQAALKELFDLARAGQIGIGGGQWRGHGWLHWAIDESTERQEAR